MTVAYAAAEAPVARVLRDFASDPRGVAGVVLLFALALLAIAAPELTSHDPWQLTQLAARDAALPPGTRGMNGHVYWLGTDDQGRDILAALLHGLRISLHVASAATAGALAIGVTAGLVASLAGSLGAGVMRAVDLQLSVPPLLIAFVLVFVLGHSITNVIIALIAVLWPHFARAMYRAAVCERRRSHVEAARALALSRSRILLRHVLPSCVLPLLVLVFAQIGAAMMLEASLTFVGLGLRVAGLSLGGLVANGYHDIFAGKYWISLFPGVVLFLALLAMNLVAYQLGDRLALRPHR